MSESVARDRLVPNRQCGGCTVCCKDLAINEPELEKPRGVLCRHCKEGGCAIYETRPAVCRSWFCGWRRLPQLDDSWRPDRSEILVSLSYDGIPEKYGQKAGLEFTLIGSLQKICWEPLVRHVAVFVDMGVPVFLAVPAGVGQPSAKVLLNDGVGEALKSADLVKVADQLVLALQVCVNPPKEKMPPE